MNISHIISLEQIKNFLKASSDLIIEPGSKKEVYAWLQTLLLRIKYRKLGKKDKGTVKVFIQKVTGYCDKQIKRLLKKHKDGTLQWEKWQKGCFAAVYNEIDVGLLHEVDEAHKLSGPATRAILKREYNVFKKEAFRKLANISSSHIYNIRKRVSYLRKGKIFDETKATFISVGKRMKPRPEGRPGFLRVDTVHQGDKGNEKGMYHINIVDEVTQSEYVFSVPYINEKYMEDVLMELYMICPFIIINFHSDNGSEYINKVVADILNRLHIKQTKSRPRKHNDNGLIETKNGWIIRKTYGYFHIPATGENANLLNGFNRKWLNVYLNYHRTCGFATTKVDRKGKEKKVYDVYMTPYAKLRSLPHAELYLKRHIFFEDLDKIAYAMSDTEFAMKMNEKKERMFQKLRL
ncbi:MAG: integrase [Candidatus Gracilibacteria bacterium]